MKKIGIITYFYFYNYGTMLQGFATQLLFGKNDGVEVELIDYRFGNKTARRKIDILRYVSNAYLCISRSLNVCI